MLEAVLESLISRKKLPDPKKCQLLELVEKDMVSTRLNSKLFCSLFEMIKYEGETIVNLSVRVIDALVKANENVSSDSKLDIRQHYLPFIVFMKMQFIELCRLPQRIEEGHYSKFRKAASHPAAQERSLKFLALMPNLLLHIMAYANLNRGEDSELNSSMKKELTEVIQIMIQSLADTRVPVIYELMKSEFTLDLLTVLNKILQFLYIALRNEKENERSSANVQILRQNVSELMRAMPIKNMLVYCINLQRDCPMELNSTRYEIAIRIKSLISILSPQRLSREEAIHIINLILSDEIKYGKDTLPRFYIRNAMENHWLDIIKTEAVICNLFPYNLYGVSEPAEHFDREFRQVERIFSICLRTLFDLSTYHHIHEKTIDTMTKYVEQLFKRPSDSPSDITAILSNGPPCLRANHEKKLTLLTKLLEVAANKLANIRATFGEIQRKIPDLRLREPHSMKYMNYNELENKSLEDLLEEESNINGSLLSLANSPQRMVNIWEEDDDLILNGISIKEDSYSSYIKETKAKIVDKLMTLVKTITTLLLQWSTSVHSPQMLNNLKNLHFYQGTATRKVLSEEQCESLSNIFREGLLIFEFFHDNEYHFEPDLKKGCFRNFMMLYSEINDPINFRDILMPNRALFFAHLLKYTRECHEKCLMMMLTESYFSSPTTTVYKNLVANLTNILFDEFKHEELSSAPPWKRTRQEPTPCWEEHFTLMQKLIRLPMRTITKYKDDTFLRNIFKQVVVLFVKKAHFSKYCMDHLLLLRTLFKNILMHNPAHECVLFNEFFFICSKSPPHSPTMVSNLDIVENLRVLSSIGIPDVIEVVAELIIILPLKSKNIIMMARTGQFVKPLINCLSFGDPNYSSRGIRTLDIVFSHSTYEEIQSLLGDMKDSLINSLVELIRQTRLSEIKNENDMSSFSIKLLVKMGAIYRLSTEMPQSKTPEFDPLLKLRLRDIDPSAELDLDMLAVVESAIEVFKRVIDPHYQAQLFMIEFETYDNAYKVLLYVGKWALEQPTLHPVIESILKLHLQIANFTYKEMGPAVSGYAALEYINKMLQKVLKGIT